MKERQYEDIWVSAYAPLIVESEEAVRHYRKVYLEEGAYIEIRTGDTFTIEELLPANAELAGSLRGSVPESTPTDTALRDWGGYDIVVTAPCGKTGGRGQDGGDGGGVGQRGQRGAHAATEKRKNFYLNIEKLGKDIHVLSIGGSGGDGGRGGNGGDGWDGTGKSNPGTIGGSGGDGGCGGDGADGIGCLYLKCTSSDGHQVEVACEGGKGGKGGNGGYAGLNGKNYDGSLSPQDGEVGSVGKEGKAGTFEMVYPVPEDSMRLADVFPLPEDDSPVYYGRVDFADPIQARKALEYLGGEEFLSVKYPALYASYLKTVEKAKQGKQLQEKKESDGTYSESFTVTAINLDRNTSLKLENAGEDNTSFILRIFNDTVVHDAEPCFCVYECKFENVTDGYSIETQSFTSFDTDLDYRFSTSPLEFVGADGKEFRETSSRMRLTNDGTMEMETASSKNVFVNGFNSIVSKITIDSPKSQFDNNPLIYLYNRDASPGEKCDKHYSASEVQYDEDKKDVNTLLGISGTVEFSEDAGVVGICGYAKDRTYSGARVLNIQGTGAARYEHDEDAMAGYFTPAASESKPDPSLTMNFSFPDNWNCRLDRDAYARGVTSVLTHLQFSFFYKVQIFDPIKKEAIPTSLEITISSKDPSESSQEYYESSNSSTVYIPPVSIRWGCFAADTEILMADYSEKPISQIKPGDMVMTPSGPAGVQSVYKGTEDELIVIETEDGKDLRVTKGHVMVCSRGIMRAEHMLEGDELSLENGDCVKIAQIYPVQYEQAQDVYNISVEKGLVYANGIVSGEFEAQNDLSVIRQHEEFAGYDLVTVDKEEPRKPVYSAETLKIKEEMEAWMRERNGLN